MALIPEAVSRLAARVGPQGVDTGFFDAEGAWVKGRAVRLGGVAVAATTDAEGAAGALLPSQEGALQLAAGDVRAREAARAFVQGRPTPLLPVALADRADEQAAVAPVPAGFVERVGRLGPSGVVLVLVLVAVLGTCGVVAAQALRGDRAVAVVAVVAGRLPGLIGAGEVAAAGALARTAPGPAGRFLRAVVQAAGRPAPEDEVAALSSEVFFALDRASWLIRLCGVVGAAVVVVTASRVLSGAIAGVLGVADVKTRAMLDALAGALLPIEIGALAALPWAALLLLTTVVVARTEERFEAVALRMLDAAARARS